MLRITIPLSQEGWDEEKEEFVEPIYKTLCLEHSLVSLSKWESKWHKPFLSKAEKSYEETIDYIKYMTVTKNVDPEVYNYITSENMKQINEYIEDPMTATTFSDDESGKRNREIITSEIIYYWMIALNIPFECRKWHLNSLLALIRVCNIKNSPKKKMSASSIMARNAKLNAARRKALNSKG